MIHKTIWRSSYERVSHCVPRTLYRGGDGGGPILAEETTTTLNHTDSVQMFTAMPMMTIRQAVLEVLTETRLASFNFLQVCDPYFDVDERLLVGAIVFLSK